MPPPAELLELVERFRRNRHDYTGDRYNETQVRREFVDPFFEALGWDVANKAGKVERFKDVIHEDQIKALVGERRCAAAGLSVLLSAPARQGTLAVYLRCCR